MTMYAVHVQILTHAGNGYAGSKSVPTFYLDSRVQGIMSRRHAARVAAGIVNPLGTIPADDLLINAYPIDPERENRELDDWQAEQSARASRADVKPACDDGGHPTWCAGTPEAHTVPVGR